MASPPTSGSAPDGTRRSSQPGGEAPSQAPGRWTVLAAGAHPDDIEFMMAGTLLQLGARGAELHMWNLADGSCGSQAIGPKEIAELRRQEAGRSAAIAGATIHPPLVEDAFILYERSLIQRVAARVRQIRPRLILTHSPQDYMEDHQDTARLLVTAAFMRGAPNFPTDPPVEPWYEDVFVYHALPHGLRDGLRRLPQVEHFVDIGPVLALKRKMLACHDSQRDWLDSTQGMGSYVEEMEEMSRRVGALSRRFEYAEGWRRHLHVGLSRQESDPLPRVLGDLCFVDREYEQKLRE